LPATGAFISTLLNLASDFVSAASPFDELVKQFKQNSRSYDQQLTAASKTNRVTAFFSLDGLLAPLLGGNSIDDAVQKVRAPLHIHKEKKKHFRRSQRREREEEKRRAYTHTV
jgi:hypothetical protein